MKLGKGQKDLPRIVSCTLFVQNRALLGSVSSANAETVLLFSVQASSSADSSCIELFIIQLRMLIMP